MPNLTFAQSSRRISPAPVLIAIVILATIAAVVYHRVSGRTVLATIPHTEAFPIRVTFKQQALQAKGFKVLSDKPVSHDEGVYILATVHIENHLTTPIFLKDLHATFDTPAGQYRASAIEKADLPAVTAAFPELSPKLAAPLLREITIAPGQSAEGTIILQFPVTESTWASRQSAALTIDLYHQPSLTIAMP